MMEGFSDHSEVQSDFLINEVFKDNVTFLFLCFSLCNNNKNTDSSFNILLFLGYNFLFLLLS